MKKCPGCGSFSSDEETACGVCGANISDTSPIEDTMEAINLKDQAVRQAQDRKEAKAQLHRIAVRTRAGLTVGLGVLVFAIIAIIENGFGTPTVVYLSFFLIPLGLWIVASVLFGGLGFNSFRELLRFRGVGWRREITEQERQAEEIQQETS